MFVLHRKRANNSGRNGIGSDPDNDNKFVLLSKNDDQSARIVIFPHLIEGHPQNISPQTDCNLIKTNLRRIIRPFVGRAQDIIKLIANITKSKFCLCLTCKSYIDRLSKIEKKGKTQICVDSIHCIRDNANLPYKNK